MLATQSTRVRGAHLVHHVAVRLRFRIVGAKPEEKRDRRGGRPLEPPQDDRGPEAVVRIRENVFSTARLTPGGTSRISSGASAASAEGQRLPRLAAQDR